jgi:hypothetical protein
MVVDKLYIGFLFIIPGTPVAGLIGWLLARRPARQLEG